MQPRTISVMAVMVVMMDAIIRRQQWRACVGAMLCLDVSNGGVRGWQRPRRIAATAVRMRGRRRRLKPVALWAAQRWRWRALTADESLWRWQRPWRMW